MARSPRTSLTTIGPRPGAPELASPLKRSQIPASPTGIIGRAAAIDAVRSLLGTGSVRLATLTGPGGIGKTRLALEVAAVAERDYAHGVHIVPLAPVRDAGNVFVAIATALRVKVVGQTPAPHAIAVAFQDQHALIVLDNVEHVVDDVAPFVSELLARCPRLQVLATSRRPLRIAGERQVPVPPLDLPPPGGAADPDGAKDAAAIQLFVERAIEVDPGFSLSAHNVRDVEAVCRRLDGVPLAIELAAARVAILPPATMLARLSHRLDDLTGNRRDTLPHHRTMRDAIAWSYDLLTEQEQRLFRLATVPVGGFTLDAIAGMAAIWAPDIDAVETLGALVDHSLIRREIGRNGGARFGLLEVVRDFGQERVIAHGEDESSRDAHAAYFARRAADAEADLFERSRLDALDALEDEHDNVWAALNWLFNQDRLEDAADLAGSIWCLRRVRIYAPEALATLQALLASPSLQARTTRRARALLLLGTYQSELGHPDDAAIALDEALAIFREHGNDLGVARALRRIAVTLTMSGRIEPAIATLKERLALSDSDSSPWETASALDYLAGLFLYQNDHAATQACLTEALRLYRRIDDRFGIASVLSTQGMLSAREGDADRARRSYQQSLELSSDFDFDYHLPIALIGLGDIELRAGNIDRAGGHLADGYRASRDSGWLHGAAVALAGLGAVALRRDDRSLALQHVHSSLDIFGRIGMLFGLQHGASMCCDVLACTAHIAGDDAAAARFLGMSDGLHERIGVARQKGEPVLVGSAELDQIRASLADPALREAWESGRALDPETMLAEALAWEPAGIDGSRPDHRRSPDPELGLTPREIDVLRLIAAGQSNREIAGTLFVSQRTVSGHVTNLLRKLDVPSRTAAAGYAIRNGLD